MFRIVEFDGFDTVSCIAGTRHSNLSGNFETCSTSRFAGHSQEKSERRRSETDWNNDRYRYLYFKNDSRPISFSPFYFFFLLFFHFDPEKLTWIIFSNFLTPTKWNRYRYLSLGNNSIDINYFNRNKSNQIKYRRVSLIYLLTNKKKLDE